MSERKQQILQTAIEIIADEGYSSLSMRALARASGMKLGALQYHFRTSDDMLRALAEFIAAEYARAFEEFSSSDAPPTIRDIAIFMLDDEAGAEMLSDRLWPQLWAMQSVEPLMMDLVQDIYAIYLQFMEDALVKLGNKSPRAEALCLMSLLEGELLFAGEGRRWNADRQAVRETALDFIDARYGAKS
ncbi:MAG: TetR/AcrR family transcriptional regulator [Pseudomonadales bacterium]